MNKQDIDRHSQKVTDKFIELETLVMTNIGSYIGKHMSKADDITNWRKAVERDVFSFGDTNRRLLAERQEEIEAAIGKSIKDAGYKSVDEFESFLSGLAVDGRLSQAPSLTNDTRLLSILDGKTEETISKFKINKATMLNKADDVYLNIVSETTRQASLGTKTFNEALRDTVSQWSERGIPSFVDRAGRRWSTEAYTSLVIRSQINDVANAMQDERFQEYGVDLVEISQHAGARPKCFPYQGNIYSLSGQDKKYPPLDKTSMGDIAGLFGANCGHVKYPYIPGVSEKAKPVIDKKLNDKMYKESQVQRHLEVGVRDKKRLLQMMEQIGDKEGIKEAAKGVREAQTAVRDYAKTTGRTRRYDREKIYD